MSLQRTVAGILLLAGGAGLYMVQRRKATVEITPRPLLYLVADTQRELERIPLALTRMSDAEENQLGEEMARQFGLVHVRDEDEEAKRIRDYLNTVGMRAVADVKRGTIRYRFHYEPFDGFVNAAALPGGQVVVGRGLLKLLESEDELAVVLGHEVAHVDERHAVERLQYEMQSRKIGLGGLYRLGTLGVTLFQAGYTKEQEFEADRVGLSLAVAAGYSPSGAIEVMQRFARLNTASNRPADSAVAEIAGMPVQAMREYFRSHPPEAERIAAFQAQIAARGWSVSPARKPFAIRAIFLTESARALDRRGLFDKAIERYKQALEVDPEYLPAWEGISHATWRSGNAAATVESATAALRHNPEMPHIWELLTKALAASSRATAPEHLQALKRELQSRVTAPTRFVIEADLAGTKLFAGRPEAMNPYRQILSSASTVIAESTVRRRMAWWMYRGGKLQDAEKELNAARQRFPQEQRTQFELAWVLSDLGRQADALQAQRQSARFEESAEWKALEALLSWRTDHREAAKAAFRAAAENDPVWMESHWPANNCSRAAAAVFSQLRAAEIVRRNQAEMRAGRRSLAAPTQNTPR